MRECEHCGRPVPFPSPSCPACGGPLASGAAAGDDDLHETRPYHPTFDALHRPAERLKDTVERLPAIDMEVTDEATDEEALRTTLVDEPPTDEHAEEYADDLPETVDVPPPRAELDLADTLVEVQPADERPAPITFSEPDSAARIPALSTGARHLDFQQFSRGREAVRATAEHDHAADDAPAPRRAPSGAGGLVRLTGVLALFTSLCWVGVAALMVATFLHVEPVPRVLSALPFDPELIVALPGLLLLLTLLAATGAEHHARAPLPASRIRIFLGRLGWFLLAALPGIGLPGGLGGALYLTIRRRPNPDPAWSAVYAADGPGATDRPVGWTLLFFTLAWQDIAAVIALTHFRTHIPWL